MGAGKLPVRCNRIVIDAMDRVEQQSPAVGPRTVRAWFDTLINPLIAALEAEARLLKERNFTWRFRPAGFERARTISQHLDSIYEANLDQFRALYKQFDALFQDHDKLLEKLRGSVNELFKSVTGSKILNRVMKSSLSRDSLRDIGVQSIAEIFGAYRKGEWREILGQYIVNRTGLLQSHYSTGKLWNSKQAEFLKVLEAPPVSEKYRAALQIADELSELDADLIEHLRDLRLSLSLSSDQPFVALETGLQHWRDPA